MADPMPKLSVTPALTACLAALKEVGGMASEVLFKNELVVKAPQLVGEALEKVAPKKDLIMALLGMVLVFHGAQFKNILLCTQVIVSFLYDTVKDSIVSTRTHFQTARGKLEADAPAKDGNDAKKATKNSAEKQRENAEIAKKVLKTLDPKQLTDAAVKCAGALFICILVIQGGLTRIAISVALVSRVASKVDALLEFPGFDDIQAWTALAVRVALFALVLPLSLVAEPLALAMNAATTGADMASEYGARFAVSLGKVADAEDLLKSRNGFLAVCGLIGCGTLWQLWTWTAGGGIAWYFQLVYFPAVLVESLLCLL